MNGRRSAAALTGLTAFAFVAGLALLTPQSTFACPKDCKSTAQKASAAVTPANSAGNATQTSSTSGTTTATNAAAQTAGCCAKDAKAIKADASLTCPGTDAKVIKANATTPAKSCTREECISKLMADGMTREQAEAKCAACLAECKASGSAKACTGATAGKMSAEGNTANSENLVRAAADNAKTEHK